MTHTFSIYLMSMHQYWKETMTSMPYHLAQDDVLFRVVLARTLQEKRHLLRYISATRCSYRVGFVLV